jgi:hypothetical protein
MAKRMIGAALIATIVASPTVAQELYPYAGVDPVSPDSRRLG